MNLILVNGLELEQAYARLGLIVTIINRKSLENWLIFLIELWSTHLIWAEPRPKSSSWLKFWSNFESSSARIEWAKALDQTQIDGGDSLEPQLKTYGISYLSWNSSYWLCTRLFVKLLHLGGAIVLCGFDLLFFLSWDPIIFFLC